MKGKSFFHKLSVLITVLPILIHGTVVVGNTAELRDYRLPSERGAQPQSQTVSPDNEFRSKVKALTRDQRRQLKEDFTREYQRATREAEKAYYQNLIRIIDECGTN